jgi:hypothetical protein
LTSGRDNWAVGLAKSLNSWEEARANRRQSVTAGFLLGAITFVILGYLRLEDHDPVRVALFGALGGAVMAVFVYRRTAAGWSPRSGRMRGFDLLLIVGGVGLVVVGLVAQSSALALSGLPFLALAAALIGLRGR